MVSEKKKQKLKEVRQELKKYRVIGIIDMHKLPARQLYEIKKKLREDAVIKMVKKRLIKLAFRDSGLKDIEELDRHVKGEPALMLSNTNPFKFAKIIDASKSKAFAKAGDIAPSDIVIRAGPTSLSPGPVIGELQRVKIPASVEGEKIAVRQDTVVARKGDVIEKPLADVLAKLGVEPIEIGLNLLAAWEDGYVYEQNLLFMPAEKYISDLKAAGMHAFNLAFSMNYYTKDNITLFLSKAHQEARALALNADILTNETIKPLVAKAKSRADVLKGMLKEPTETVKEEQKELKEDRVDIKKEEMGAKKPEDEKEVKHKAGEEKPKERKEKKTKEKKSARKTKKE